MNIRTKPLFDHAGDSWFRVTKAPLAWRTIEWIVAKWLGFEYGELLGTHAKWSDVSNLFSFSMTSILQLETRVILVMPENHAWAEMRFLIILPATWSPKFGQQPAGPGEHLSIDCPTVDARFKRWLITCVGSFSFPSYPSTPSTDKWVTQAQRWRARRKRGVSSRKPVRCSWKAYICVVRILIIVTEVGICQHCQQPLEPSEGGRAWRFCHEADIEAYRPFPKLFEERRFCRQVVSVSISSTL